MVGLVEVLLDVLVLIGDFGPNLNGLLDAKDTARGQTKVFAKAVVDEAGNAYIERTGTFLANPHGLEDAGSKPCDMLVAVVGHVLCAHDVTLVETHGKLHSFIDGKLLLEGFADGL